MKNYYKQIIPIQRCCVGACEHSVKVTKINSGYNIRIFLNNSINQEARTSQKIYIGKTIAELLRTEDKCGNISPLASNSRERKFKTHKGYIYE